MDLGRTVAQALGELAPEGARLLLAVSGGADSVAALLLLTDLGRPLVVAHLDHGLRDESSEDAAFVAALCSRLGVTQVSERVDVAAVADRRGWNVEDAARRVRYDFLHRAAGAHDCDVIVTAHTQDDQAETFMLQALRGGAYPSGMPARRGVVIRPFLGVSRRALREYLAERGATWREDASNLDVSRTRAWLRHEVMPIIEHRQPHAAAQLARTAAGLAEAKDAVDGVAEALFGAAPLRVAALTRAPRAVGRAAIVRLLEAAGVTPTAELVRAVQAAAAEAAREPTFGPWRRSVGTDTVVRVAYGRVDVARTAPLVLDRSVPIEDEQAWHTALRRLPVARPAAPPDSHTVAGWLERHGGLELRHRDSGDRVEVHGGHKLLSDLLIDRKVPAEERDGLLVLAVGSAVLWVEGLGLDGSGSRDERFMRVALEQAALAVAGGDLPVGAALVRGDEVIAVGHNRSEATGDPTAHAELEVVRAAGAAEGDWRLAGTTLYVTLEPCPMCFGAVLQTRIDRVVFGADNLREGASGGAMDLRVGPWKRVPEVTGGVLEAECRRVLSAFFVRRRGAAPTTADTHQPRGDEPTGP